jgi:hypothetical protein
MSRVVAKRNIVESENFLIGQDTPRDMPSTGPARIDPAVIEPTDRPIDKTWAEEMQFNEDILVVRVHESTDKNADPVPDVGVNGQMQCFQRGVEQFVRRKFVAKLAQSKVTTFSQVKKIDSAGNEFYQNVPHTALKYPFAVVEDPSPRGKVWLQSLLAQA